MTTSIDHSEQVTWQRQALAVLDTLLAQSLKTELPRLAWTIGHGGVNLVGRSYAHPSTSRRTEIQAWANSLDLELRERQQRDGMITLTAHATQKQFGKLWATITLTCDIWPEDDDQEASR